MKKVHIAMLLVLVVLILSFIVVACVHARYPYSEKDFIGLTSQEIIEKYGKFDHAHAEPADDGLFRSTYCGYIVIEAKVGFFGTEPPELFVIYFNGDGVAYQCAYETGGWGG